MQQISLDVNIESGFNSTPTGKSGDQVYEIKKGLTRSQKPK
jgi:hypothetical protein